MKGVIFDLDGVIVTTDKYHYSAWKQIADEENIYFDEKINNRLRGVSRMESLDIILECAKRAYTEDEKQVLAEKKNSYYVDSLNSLSSEDILPGVIPIIKQLKSNSIKIAIGSSSKNTEYILGKIGIYDMFDTVISGNDIVRSKPDPEVFLLAAKQLSLSPPECIVIEDAIAGIDAANSACMTSVAVGDAAGYMGADYRLTCIDELLLLPI